MMLNDANFSPSLPLCKDTFQSLFSRVFMSVTSLSLEPLSTQFDLELCVLLFSTEVGARGLALISCCAMRVSLLHR